MNNKIMSAKVQLIQLHPFFATIALQVPCVPDPNIETACTDGTRIAYNPAFIEKLSVDEVQGILAHVILHLTMFHHLRRHGRDMERWNIAADYAINPLLLEAGFCLPDGFLYENSFKSKSAEEIYSILPDPDTGDGKGSGSSIGAGNSATNGHNRPGDFADLPPAVSRHAAEAELKQVLSQAAMIANKQGKLPSYLKRLVEQSRQAAVSWREQLSRFLEEVSNSDYNWTKPSARYLHAGLYLPSPGVPSIGKIILLVDTSGSIDGPLLSQFIAETREIATCMPEQLLVIYVDAAVQGIQEISVDDPEPLTPVGRGGTDFCPGFAYIDEHELNPAAVIYLTDGYCDAFPDSPAYPVIWAIFGSRSFTSPFGESINIEL